MDVARHQYVDVNLAAEIEGELAQVLQVALPIEVGKKAGLGIIAALDNMFGDTRSRRG